MRASQNCGNADPSCVLSLPDPPIGLRLKIHRAPLQHDSMVHGIIPLPKRLMRALINNIAIRSHTAVAVSFQPFSSCYESHSSALLLGTGPK